MTFNFCYLENDDEEVNEVLPDLFSSDRDAGIDWLTYIFIDSDFDADLQIDSDLVGEIFMNGFSLEVNELLPDFFSSDRDTGID